MNEEYEKHIQGRCDGFPDCKYCEAEMYGIEIDPEEI